MKAALSVTTALALGLGLAGAASAQNQYVSGSLGYNFQADSDNDGVFTEDFVTGDGSPAVPAETVLASGTDVGWTTEFDGGLFAAAAYGWRFGNNFRLEGELSYTSSDVDTHDGVAVGGGSIDAVDAAVLITGSPPLGVTVGDLVADGQGEIESIGFAVNGYYDWRFVDSPFSVYAGAGAGFQQVDVTYEPSDTPILDGDETVGFFQLMAGGAYMLDNGAELFGGYRYRVSEDVEVDASLIPATFEIENENHILEAGVRFHF